MAAELRLLVDMNISPHTVESLRQWQWDVVRVSQVLPATASDVEILDLARREGRVVVTQDLDFAALLALGGFDRPSVVTLRMSVASPEAITRRLLETLPRVREALLQGCAVTIEDVAMRIRGLPIGADH